MSTPTQTLLENLQGVKVITGGWSAHCPAHEDARNSLSVSEGEDGRALVHCHAGCDPVNILAALQLSPADLFPPREKAPKPARQIVARYDYRDEHGIVLYQSVRFEPKDFLQRRRLSNGTWEWKLGDVPRVLYRLPELARQTVAWVVEGEKDADKLAALGLPATTNAGGANKWRPEYTEQLRRAGIAHVVVLPDNDAAGVKHGHQVGRACLGAGLAVKVVALPGLDEHGDVSDWLAQGHTRADLLALVKEAPRYQPDDVGHAEAGAVSSESAVAATCFHLTELGAAEFFVDRHKADVRFDHLRQRWLVWVDHRWVPDADALIHRLANEHMRRWQRDAMELGDRDRRQKIVDFALRMERKGAIENLLGVARNLKPVSTAGKEWDRDLFRLGTINGVLDLRTGILADGHPDDLITMSVNAEYHPDAPCPQWAAFLESVLPDPTVRMFLQTFVGYSLTGSTDEQVLAMLYGKGSNGKSTLLSVLVDLLGDYAKTIAFSALEFKKSDVPSDIAALQHVRFVMASEVKEGQRLNEARIKALTGGDTVAARYLYSEWFNFKPAAKFFLAVNHKPTVGDDSYGFWRRIRLVPFLQSFTGNTRVPDLQQRLLEERNGILRWAVDGCLQWQREQLFTPEAVYMASHEYQAESDPLAEFVDEVCQDDPESETKAGVAYATYVKWADARRTPKDSILRPQAFGMRFSEKHERVRRSFGQVYVGVRLATDRMF